MTRSAIARLANAVAAVSLVLLIFLCLAWELWLAPLRPGGSTLALKSVPLLFPLFGILRGRRYTHQWTSMLALLYVAEGLVRVAGESGTARVLATAELVLATLLYSGAVAYSRATRAA